ncbi:MAG: iron-sulfur cluster assembly accessory protein [Pseudomonadota bacterium]
MATETFDPRAHPSVAVQVTDEAARHIAQQIESTGRQHIRLGVKESGCNGYMYTLDYIDGPADDDQACFDAPDKAWQLYVSPRDLLFVQGTEIVLEVHGLNRTLKFKNPNAESHCGCGESFSVAS